MTWSRILTSARTLRLASRQCSVVVVNNSKDASKKSPRKILDDEITDSDFAEDQPPNILASDLGKKFDFSDYGPQLNKTQTFGGYANKSLSLQKLIDLGVDLSRIEKQKDAMKHILGMDFDRDISKYLQ